MATWTDTIGDIFTATFANRRRQLMDNIFKDIPLLTYLRSKGRAVEKPGDLRIEIPIMYGKNPTTTWLGRGDSIPLTDYEMQTLAKYDWKLVAATVRRYNADELRLSGKNRVLNYINDKLDNAQKSISENIELALTVQQAGDKVPLALSSIISTTPEVGSIGDIDGATNVWWRNKARVASGSASIYLLSDLRKLYRSVGEGQGGYPDFHLVSPDVKELYDAMFDEKFQFTDSKLRDLGLSGETYNGAPLEVSSNVPAGTWYMLNSNALQLCISDNAGFGMTPWKTMADTVNDYVAQIASSMALVVSSRRKLGVLSGIIA